MKNMFPLFLSTLWVLTLVGSGGWALAEAQDCFSSSLHHTGEGMRYWYEADDGFMAITGTPYKDLGCNACHVQNTIAFFNWYTTDKSRKVSTPPATHPALSLKSVVLELIGIRLPSERRMKTGLLTIGRSVARVSSRKHPVSQTLACNTLQHRFPNALCLENRVSPPPPGQRR